MASETATHCVLFARLIVNQEDHGITNVKRLKSKIKKEFTHLLFNYVISNQEMSFRESNSVTSESKWCVHKIIINEFLRGVTVLITVICVLKM